MGDKRSIALLKADERDRPTVGGESARNQIQLRGAELEQLLAFHGIDRRCGAVALFVRNQQEIACAADAAGQNGGVEFELRLDRRRIGQDGLLAAAVIDENVRRGGFHDWRSVAERHAECRHAARTRKVQRVTVRVSETGLEQRTVRKQVVFEPDVCDVALMLPHTGKRVLRRPLNGRGCKQAVMGQHKAERADRQHPAAYKPQSGSETDARIAVIFKKNAALLARRRKVDQVFHFERFFFWCIAHQGSPPHCIAF